MTDIRETVAEHAIELASMTPGTSGNLSCCSGERVAITPSGLPYPEIEADDVPVLTLSGEVVAGELQPSTETPLHLTVYEELEAGSIVHTHSPWATTLAVLREPVPPVHYTLAAAGVTTSVPVAEYATYGTREIARNAVSVLSESGSRACLLANHGLVAIGEGPVEALDTARSVEFTARTYCQAMSLGEPVHLTEKEMQESLESFDEYGQEK